VNLLVIGSTGPLGRLIVDSALAAQHNVTVLMRNLSSAQFSSKVKRMQGDVLSVESLAEAMRGQHAVISSLGSKISLKPITILSDGTRNMVTAMRGSGVRRFVCVTGIGAGDSKGHGGFLYDHLIQPFLLNQVYLDKTRQEAVVRESGLEWTIVRPAQLTNGPARGPMAYRVLSDLNGITATKISRKDVADFTVETLLKPDHLGKAVLITY